MQDVRENNENSVSIKTQILALKGWINHLRTKWVILLAAAIIGAAIGFTYGLFQKVKYTASLSFVLEDEKSSGGLSGALGLASQFGLDLGGGGGSAFSGSNLILLMKSRSMIERVLLSPIVTRGKDISMIDRYLEFKGLRKKWAGKNLALASVSFPVNADRKSFTIQQDSILGEVYATLAEKNIVASQKDKKSTIYSVDMVSEDEMFAKRFVEQLVNEVSQYYIDTKSKKAQINFQVLQNQVDSVRQELNSSLSGAAVANDRTYNLNPAFNIQRVPSSKKQIDVQANTAILTELVKNFELAKVTLRRETPLIQTIDTPILPLKRTEDGTLRLLAGGAFLGMIVAIAFIFLILAFKKIS
ncbi:lipopolysaccharide biosynthesis protein [Sediminibacterium ginsengisoli]|uniref:Chain length determinant protein n=1 Tax=Sediminibacterium ginsengisoli TaxID=413434 RepID=A0A1T4N583_9BACT|nr:lipopolysaccharide biosynthesis protein [Sediminibacterium ginsengisoli]SJZ74413.1 Chain length determinant protein [Sediminibacterium ginsengisoli]